MNLRRLGTRRTLVAGIAMLAVVAGAGAAIAASTDTFDPEAERDAFQAAVAKKLGVTTQQLEDAYKAAALERLDAAVKAGRITEEQAKEMRARIESGEFPGPMGGMHGGPGMGGPMMGVPGMRGGHLDAAATYLGLTTVQLQEKLAAGTSLADVAKAEGKSVDGLKAALLADAKKKLDQAVADGTITAAQRDTMLEHMTSRVDDIVDRTGPPMDRMGRGHSPGMHSGPGGMNGGFGGMHGDFGGDSQGAPDA